MKLTTSSSQRLIVSASSILPITESDNETEERTSILHLPSMVYIENVTPSAVPDLMSHTFQQLATTTSPLATEFETMPDLGRNADLRMRPCRHGAVILLCSHRTRDARCGISAPILRRELERQLRPLGLLRDVDDERPGGVGIYFVSHVGGHKYSANMLIYRRGQGTWDDIVGPEPKGNHSTNGQLDASEHDQGAVQGIWLARVSPKDCPDIVKHVVLAGRLFEPEKHLRAGFDRGRQVTSW